MIAMDATQVDGTPNLNYFGGVYAVEGHPDNSASVPAAPPPPAIIPQSQSVALIPAAVAAVTSPTPIAAVTASLIGSTLAAPTPTTGAGVPAAGGGTTGGLIAPTYDNTPVTAMSDGGAGFPGPVIPTASDVGVGGASFALPSIAGAAPTSANGSTPGTTSSTGPTLSPLTIAAIGAALLLLR